MKRETKKIKKTLLPFLTVFLFFFLPLLGKTQDNNLMNNFLRNAPYLVNTELITLIFNVIRYLLGFLGVVAVVILIYGGFLWMTARGNEEQIKKAKKTLINGLIGLIIVILAFVIVQFVIGRIIGGGGGGISQPPSPPGGLPNGANYLVVTSKYPRPSAVVARNNKIIITFSQNLDTNTVKLARPDSPTTCPEFTVAIKKDNEFLDGSLKVRGNALIFVPKTECPPPLNANRCNRGVATNCSLELKPDGCCGCFSVGQISVTLKSGQNGLKGKRAQGNTLARDVNWNFEVGNYLETSSPEVENNLPQGNNVSRNIGLAAIFTKEIDLSTLKVYNPECVEGSANCNKDNCGIDSCLGYAVGNIDEATVKITINNVPVSGFFERLSTKVFIFRPKDYCPAPAQGCRCWPETSAINVELTTEIKDVNCNRLDCTNGKCTWQFTTSNNVDLDPPSISLTDPVNNAVDIDRLTNIQSIFTDPSGTAIDPTSVNEDTFVVGPEILAREISTNLMTSIYKPYRVLEANTRYFSILYGGGQPGKTCQLEPNNVWGVKDLAGNAMTENYSWSFTTSNQVGIGEPRIDWVSPSQGPVGQCVTIHGYNLGCCANPGDCSPEAEAQNKYRIGGECKSGNTAGKVEFCKTWEKINNKYICSEYISGQVLVWKEIDINENEIVVRVPEGTSNRPANQYGQIKVTPVHD